MLDKDIVRIAKERVLLEISDQNANLQLEIARIKEEANARGTFGSGSTILRIANLCNETIKARAQLIWQTLFRFITTAGITYSDDLADELKNVVAIHLPQELTDLKGLVRENAELIGSPDLFVNLEPQMVEVRNAALAKVDTEIDLFVHSLKKKVEMKEKEAASTIFNIYSPVGAIQTGESSIANVAQNIDTEIREQLNKVLEEIASELAKSDSATPHPKGEIIELVQEGQEELKKSSPNMMKLRSTLSAVGISIQTVANMKPAYETLRQTLTFLGISLP